MYLFTCLTPHLYRFDNFPRVRTNCSKSGPKILFQEVLTWVVLDLCNIHFISYIVLLVYQCNNICCYKLYLVSRQILENLEINERPSSIHLCWHQELRHRIGQGIRMLRLAVKRDGRHAAKRGQVQRVGKSFF